MKRILKYTAIAAFALMAVACSKSRPEQMKMAENVKITCNPEVLEAVNGEIPVTISVQYPEGYFHPKAVMIVTPVIIYEGGQQVGESYTYQGEKVKDNYKVVPSAGGTVKESMKFNYVDGMQRCFLELRSTAYYKDKKWELPAVKIADGCRVNYQLASLAGASSYKDSQYQEVIRQSTEGQILYKVNSSDVRKSELNSSSIQDFQNSLEDIMHNERMSITGNEIIAYASPEGGVDLNSKLSNNRAESAKKAWGKVSNGLEAGDPQIKSIGQDWEGFQEAVSNSDIQDKDLILRVLSMYSDPAVRESEIRNMSNIFLELKDEVFPELRRARFITNFEYQNYTEAELKELAEKRVYALDEPALLKLASMQSDPVKKALYNRYAAEKFNSQTGLYNLALSELEQGMPAAAKVSLDKIADQNDPQVLNAQGIVALQGGDLAKAAEYFKKAGSDEAKANLGTIDILKGDYAAAATKLAGSNTANEGLAYLLNGQADKAASVLQDNKDAESEYIKAIIAARKGETFDAKTHLDNAYSLDESLKLRAAKDIEFASFK